MILPAGQSLAEIVVRLAFEDQRDATGQECAERLSGGTGELDRDGVVRQTLKPVLFRNLGSTASVPTVRFTFLIGRSSVTFSPFSIAGLQSSISLLSRMSARP